MSLGVPNLKQNHLILPEWSGMAVKYHMSKSLGLHSGWARYILVTPLLILNLSQECKFPVALAQALNHHEEHVFKGYIRVL
jgi:hypothetical protein